MKALVLVEHADAVSALCAGARSHADEVALVAIGDLEVPAAVADTVFHLVIPEAAVYDDAAASVIALFDAQAPGVVFVEPTRRMKSIAGKLAAHANTAVITDAFALEGDEATSLYFGGVGERTLKANGVAIYTIKPEVFAGLEAAGANAVEEIAWVAPEHPLRLVSTQALEKGDVDLYKADVVVAAGRGFAEKEELGLAEDLCEKLGAGLGCSRPLTEGVDWLPSSVYIGVSGLMLSPKVYIGCGISGQMQHMVGCNRAGTLFAINKDKNAPIFKQCDFGLVGDIKTVLPALVAAL